MRRSIAVLRPLAVASLVLGLFLLTVPRSAHALQIVPSIGISQATDGGDNRAMLALALRQGMLPRTQLEFQVAHRSETFESAGESFTLRTVPVTLSVWASPVPMLYAGGGVGAYLQGVEYGNNIYPATNDTQFGAHLGGGFRFSLVPMVGLDLQGRYVFLEEKTSSLASGDFDPSFWTVSAGVVIGF